MEEMACPMNENWAFKLFVFGVQNYDLSDWVLETKPLEGGQQSATAFIFRNDDGGGSSKGNRLSHQICLVKKPPFLPLPRTLTWHMKLGMTLWKEEPLNPKPFSPVQRARKFSEVLGTTSARSWTEHVLSLNFKILDLDFWCFNRSWASRQHAAEYNFESHSWL